MSKVDSITTAPIQNTPIPESARPQLKGGDFIGKKVKIPLDSKMPLIAKHVKGKNTNTNTDSGLSGTNTKEGSLTDRKVKMVMDERLPLVTKLLAEKKGATEFVGSTVGNNTKITIESEKNRADSDPSHKDLRAHATLSSDLDQAVEEPKETLTDLASSTSQSIHSGKSEGEVFQERVALFTQKSIDTLNTLLEKKKKEVFSKDKRIGFGALRHWFKGVFTKKDEGQEKVKPNVAQLGMIQLAQAQILEGKKTDAISTLVENFQDVGVGGELVKKAITELTYTLGRIELESIPHKLFAMPLGSALLPAIQELRFSVLMDTALVHIIEQNPNFMWIQDGSFLGISAPQFDFADVLEPSKLALALQQIAKDAQCLNFEDLKKINQCSGEDMQLLANQLLSDKSELQKTVIIGWSQIYQILQEIKLGNKRKAEALSINEFMIFAAPLLLDASVSPSMAALVGGRNSGDQQYNNDFANISQQLAMFFEAISR